ncbi:GNAT family N-acetyltransferase [Desulfoferrobacter suflitae]|uniref:GNAT family N-acetyltransferase n=1 Tax=Desulfoferrobacter suflitae TaxID=2865782 RepID=UPI002164E620|nr:GNAT family N-acetyltransferase [Desulfoferrobacter suflitae]MCK8601632.1 GNAT family N-acetyltransferase [Desulfoferrobacter suflitae]
MATTSYWADNYVEKARTVEEAVSLIRSGQRVFIGSSCGEPQCLVRGLSQAANNFTDLEIVRLLSLESTPLTLIAAKSKSQSLNIRSFYLGSVRSKELAKNMRFLTPINLSEVPRLFKSRLLPLHVALIQVSPPDDFGWMSLGVSVDVTLAAAFSADLVIAQVNSRMPRVLGQGFIHVNDVDVIVEHEEELITIGALPESEPANIIGRHIANLIDDGSTIQISLGTTPQATLLALSEKNDLGVHSQFLTNDMMHLVSTGVITNRKKGFNEGKLVASIAIGTTELYDFLDSNPSVEFHSSDYVNDPRIISRHHKMVSMNVAMAVDLTGQVAADALPFNYYSGVSGTLDFIRGTALSQEGKSILMLMSTTSDGKKSRIVPLLHDTGVVVPRGDVQYIVTEYGAVNLFGKSYQERAMAMISIAHPDFREELFHAAKKMGLLGAERTLSESIHGIYPVKLVETLEIDGEMVTIRPTKPVDERALQEHFYTLDKQDVISRFFRPKTSFLRTDVEGMSRTDYQKNLTLVAVVGEVGFERVVGVGEYYLEEAKNMAEVAFSVSKDWQGRGLGRILINKLSEAARENGIAGLFAYTSPENQRMMKLFMTLPYKVRTVIENELFLSCTFGEPS